MRDGEIDSFIASDLLRYRKNLPWKREIISPGCWERPYLIDNHITRAYAENRRMEESRELATLRDAVERELAHYPAAKQRLWLAEYRFMEKLMSFRQLAIYAPAFLTLSRVMPRKMIFCRREVVHRYLKLHSLQRTPFVEKLCRQFVRSSVLLYPAESLVLAADKFIRLASRSADQSKKLSRHRVAILLRSHQMMSDAEICERFQCEEIYLDELALLTKLADYYRLTLDDIFKVSVEEINRFWDIQY
ncbi:MAG: hypothetical protein CMN56_13810 [Sneathiella sp.]|nr:hypothetical protein [Sneathiella sp.]